MTGPPTPHSPMLPSEPGLEPDRGSADEVDLGEELCRVQAEILEMGADNYERLRRMCPEPDRRFRVLRSRVNHQVNLVLTAWAPRWRQALRPSCDPAATSTAAHEVWMEFDPWGVSEQLGDAAGAPERGDGFSPGAPRDAERCWRCDARAAASDIGLCEPCHGSLTSR